MALIVSFTVGAIFVLASSLGTCVDVPSWKEKNYGFTFHCPNGEAAYDVDVQRASLVKQLKSFSSKFMVYFPWCQLCDNSSKFA